MTQFSRDAAHGVDLLRAASSRLGAAPVVPVVQRASDTLFRTLMKADDSNGEIQGVVDELLDLHPELCAADPPPAKSLVDWLLAWQFGESGGYFALDIVQYATALGGAGLRRYREQLAESAETEPLDFLGERPILVRNQQRLAVIDRDAQAVIRTHVGSSERSYRFEMAAKALAEIDELGLAIEYAHRGALVEKGHQAESSGRLWRDLIARFRPSEATAVAREVFEAWPTAKNATVLHGVAGDGWSQLEREVLGRLRESPREILPFVLDTLGDSTRAWSEAQDLEARGVQVSERLWARLVRAHRTARPMDVLPVVRRLIESELRVADSARYRGAVAMLTDYCTLCASIGVSEVGLAFVAELCERYARRPRLLEEVRRARLG
ncbi:hypothetical protein AX769_11270 [Frondihabitans sp. PAMC 28766]|nr:hypothetical protein AX769_11270 [Frondihabitans sp. PAMC 28766]